MISYLNILHKINEQKELAQKTNLKEKYACLGCGKGQDKPFYLGKCAYDCGPKGFFYCPGCGDMKETPYKSYGGQCSYNCDPSFGWQIPQSELNYLQ